MKTINQIQIPLSKLKIVLMLIGALAFVLLGLWCVLEPASFTTSYRTSTTKITIAGYASIIFFGICAAFLIHKLFDTKPGMIIDDKGLIDNSSGSASGYIFWNDIENISVMEIRRQKLILLHIKNPQDYISRQKSLFKRKNMALCNKMYGTPLSITANGLKITFDTLLTIIKPKFQEKRKSS